MLKDNCIRVILICSGFILVVLLKLIVYKIFRCVINENEIYLYYEYEDFDDIVKLIVNNIVLLFCFYFDLVIYVIYNDFYKIMFYNYDKFLKVMEI